MNTPMFEVLQNLDLHDKPVSELLFKFKQDEIELSIIYYQEEFELYHLKQLLFKEVDFSQCKGSFLSLDLSELTTFDFEELENENFFIKLVFLSEFGGPSSSIGIVFKKLSILDLGEVDY